APANAGHDGKGPVFLDVRVNTIVDESRRTILVVIAAPDHVEHVTERRLADLAALAVAVDVEDLLHRLEPLAAQDLAQVILRERPPAAQDLLSFFLEVRRHRAQDVLTERRTASTARACSRRLFQLRQRADAAFVNGLNHRALRDPDTPADRGTIGHL